MAQKNVHARVVIEVMGKPKEHVEQSLAAYMDKIKNDKELEVIKFKVYEAKPQDDMFSTFAEIEFKVEKMQNLVAFCLDYMPSSIEIIEPKEFALNQSEITDFFNDLQGKLHNIDMTVKNLRFESEALKRTVNNLIRNIIFRTLQAQKATLQQISATAGIPEETMKNYLENLTKADKIKKDGEFYLIK